MDFSSFFSSILPIRKYIVYGNSMSPTINHGQTALVNKLAYRFSSPRKGDIIVFYERKREKELIKRVIVSSSGSIIVEGDNKAESTDSRVFGAISKRDIIGKVIAIL